MAEVMWSVRLSSAERRASKMYRLKSSAAIAMAMRSVEGSIMLRLAHGQIYKMRTDTAGLGRFVYMWLPEAYVAGLNAMGGVA